MADFISTMAADGKLYQRGGKNKFIGCLGVCLGFSDVEKFKKTYTDLTSSVFKTVIEKTHRSVIKSTDINRYTWNRRDLFLESLGEFVGNINNSNVIINAVFTTLNPQRLPEQIKIYGADRTPEERVDAIKFLNDLSNYYPYVLTWKVSKAAHLHGADVYLDNFSNEEVSVAWNELCAHHNVKVYPHGDSCNAFISAADLITRYIDEYLYARNLHLDEESINNALESCQCSNMRVFYVGHPELDQIVPLSKQKIDFREYYPKPMVFIIRKGLLEKAEIAMIENSPTWHRILNYASEINGAVKFIDFQKDSQYLKPGDTLIFYDKDGEDKARYIQSMGYDVDIKSISEFR
ncbi:MAG: hypothetical protein PHF57_12705 [Methanoregula sp.]|jgi:hypothetical protein|nr:hypothetical protein [Methanoregula sp.]